MRLGFNMNCRIMHSGRKYRVNTDYARVLRALSLLRDESISGAGRVSGALRLLMRGRVRLAFKKRCELLNMVFDLLNPPQPNRFASGVQSKNTLSVEKDGALIYAAFLQAFGINLHRERLDWRVFSSLLTCIPENTALYRIMQIRAEEKSTDYNTGLEELFNKLERSEN